MASIADDGFVIAGGAALVFAGISERPTQGLDAFSASCDDVEAVAHRLAAELRATGYLVDEHSATASFAQLTVATGPWRRSELRIELGRDAQLFAAEPTAIGPRLSVRELAANKILAAFGRHETRDLVDLHALRQATDLTVALDDAAAKDPGFDIAIFREMIATTAQLRDDLWPKDSDPGVVRTFTHDYLHALSPSPPRPSGIPNPEPTGLEPDLPPTGPDIDGPDLTP